MDPYTGYSPSKDGVRPDRSSSLSSAVDSPTSAASNPPGENLAIAFDSAAQEALSAPSAAEEEAEAGDQEVEGFGSSQGAVAVMIGSEGSSVDGVAAHELQGQWLTDEPVKPVKPVKPPKPASTHEDSRLSSPTAPVDASGSSGSSGSTSAPRVEIDPEMVAACKTMRVVSVDLRDLALQRKRSEGQLELGALLEGLQATSTGDAAGDTAGCIADGSKERAGEECSEIRRARPTSEPRADHSAQFSRFSYSPGTRKFLLPIILPYTDLSSPTRSLRCATPILSVALTPSLSLSLSLHLSLSISPSLSLHLSLPLSPSLPPSLPPSHHV